MHIPINPADDLPIYRQIMRHLTDAIVGGRLAAGDKLPSHRELSELAVVAPLTVKKAYDELEAAGYIETQRGRGTFVCARLPKISRTSQQAQLMDLARGLLSQAYLGGLQLPDVITVLERADRELRDGPTHKRGSAA
jgi:GntR family transcriptional regulator